MSNLATLDNKKINAVDFYKEAVKVSPRKSIIGHRTKTQYEYIKNMKNKNIVFEIGPVGTQGRLN